MDLLRGKTLFRLRKKELEEEKGEEVVEREQGIEQKGFVCFFFAARFCPPCRRFAPSFLKFYQVQVFPKYLRICVDLNIPLVSVSLSFVRPRDGGVRPL